ncbi:hypothetical protein [Convivina intestini]|uniref:Uncharacterized protein n=1 Tax=Convivina intestini TaxID=1505726 RepID=A0A2U1DCA0_9LACO|nr:hypothetical protein [Convivina intestini]PVY85323.1 hypothetical protein C7384_102143 [Convivina intestini]CAH1852862.1 hypothetical protein R077811_00541 [Convivina intestini]SDB86340.1 hypothetical protein SAMN05216341_102116 [Leuconostocaceae bacterium R-53105]
MIKLTDIQIQSLQKHGERTRQHFDDFLLSDSIQPSKKTLAQALLIALDLGVLESVQGQERNPTLQATFTQGSQRFHLKARIQVED